MKEVLNSQSPQCFVRPLPGIGEQRIYRYFAQPFAAHSHDHYVIGLIEEGNRRLRCNEKEFDVCAGDIIVFNPGDVHACEQSDGSIRIFFWGLLCIMPATFLFGQGVPPLPSLIDPINAANLLFLGAIASAACFVTWGVSVKNLGAAVSTTYIYLVPAITSTSSILVLGEPLNCTIIIGVLLTIAGLLLSHSKTS